MAAAHAAPVFMDKAATIKKTVQLIEKAAADDIKLLVFPETFIPGYPVGLSLHLPAPRLALVKMLTVSTVLGRVLPATEASRCVG